MAKEKDPAIVFEHLLTTIRNTSLRIAHKHPLAAIIYLVYDNKIKVCMHEPAGQLITKKCIRTKCTTRFISHLITNGVNESSENEFPLNMELEPGVTFFIIRKEEIKKI